jgi:hypothetical protein
MFGNDVICGVHGVAERANAPLQRRRVSRFFPLPRG